MRKHEVLDMSEQWKGDNDREGPGVSNAAPFHVWAARHDNGWLTQAVEKPDGTYAAWAHHKDTIVAGPDYVEMDSENAKRAAEFALARKSGHWECSSACSGWELSHGH
jgi:hypothetical protein